MLTRNCQLGAKMYDGHRDRYLLRIPFKVFAVVIVSLPLSALFICFTCGMLFKFDEVTKVYCGYKNVVPSISAVSGVQPLRYIWRICIALHCAPRFIVGLLYYNLYMDLIHNVTQSQRRVFKRVARLALAVYELENACLVGVSYISNLENYKVHERLFIVFMVSSLVYELLAIVLFRWTHPDPMDENAAFSYKWKRRCFVAIMCCTGGLLFFFVRHRFYCEPGAFNYFASFEYGIAILNIAFHYTGATDFAGLCWYVGPDRAADGKSNVSQNSANHKINAKTKSTLEKKSN